MPRLLFRLLVIALLIGGFAWGVTLILHQEPPARKARLEAATPLVQVLPSRPAEYTLTSRVYGSVRPAHALTIRPQVGGRLQQLHPEFEPGGVIAAGENLYRIEDADYQLAVEAAQADIAKAKAEIALEQGRGKVAAEEFKLLKGSVRVDAGSRELALRAPQLRQVQAQLRQAQNALAQAELQLARTRAALPYDVVVLSRERVAGEVLAARDAIGRVARADRFWVALQVPPELLARLHARSATSPGSTVTVLANGVPYPAEVTRVLAELSEGSRLAGVIAEVLDPLGGPANGAGETRPDLLIGSYVEADIQSGRLRNSLKVPRSALQDGRVWVVDAQDTLQVRDARTRFIGPEFAYLAPLRPGDWVLAQVPTGLAPGTRVRTETLQP